MRRRSPPPLAPVPGGLHRRPQEADQDAWPKFYADEVVSSEEVNDPDACLGPPDGRFAEILPRGRLIIRMEKPLLILPSIGIPEEGLGAIPGSGAIVGKGGKDFGLEGWYPLPEARNGEDHAWAQLGISSTGFCAFPQPGYPAGPGPEFNTIRITNTGAEPLYVDAVIGFEPYGLN